MIPQGLKLAGYAFSAEMFLAIIGIAGAAVLVWKTISKSRNNR